MRSEFQTNVCLLDTLCFALWFLSPLNFPCPGFRQVFWEGK